MSYLWLGGEGGGGGGGRGGKVFKISGNGGLIFQMQ